MSFEISLCVNNRNGDVTDTCYGVDIEFESETVMSIECEISFLEIPNNVIQLGNNTYSWMRRSTMVGNVHWNLYELSDEDAIHLINYLKFADNLALSLNEAYQPLWDKWRGGNERFAVSDFRQAVAW